MTRVPVILALSILLTACATSGTHQGNPAGGLAATPASLGDPAVASTVASPIPFEEMAELVCSNERTTGTRQPKLVCQTTDQAETRRAAGRDAVMLMQRIPWIEHDEAEAGGGRTNFD